MRESTSLYSTSARDATSESSAKERTYFPNLDGLRAIGAFIVLFSHFYFMKRMWGIQVDQWFPIPGKVGVALFFSLSGFLITSLLFSEQRKTGTITLKAFYIRRIFRIWPLYYFVVLLGLLVFNQVSFLKIPVLSDRMIEQTTWLSVLNVLLIIPNFTHFYIPYTDQRWSIIVEEMFYFFQPALVRFFTNKYTLIFLFCCIVVSAELVPAIMRMFGLGKYAYTGFMGSVVGQLGYLGCIAMGCIFSALYKKKEAFCKKYLFIRRTELLVIGVLLAFIFISYFTHNEEFFDLRLYSLLFAIVVLNGALNPSTIYKLEIPWLKFLGKISYGIYMYHMFCLGIGFIVARKLTSVSWLQNGIYFVLSVSLTILVSWLSFKYFESYFLKFNKKYRVGNRKVKQGA